MSIFHSLNTSASALTAQRMRMDVISSNMANIDTTRGRMVDGEWQPYRRKTVTFQPREGQFATMLQAAMGRPVKGSAGYGVTVSRIKEDTETPFKLVFDPTHPDANEEGYVSMPNVDPLRETIDLLSATRSFEANVTVLNANKAMLMKALEIGK
ncbi:flagellar basal body rod protein FlgC [Sporosarcina sp. 179-K 3D1 HS]|uniref:flagellar basal body rod protein FlgC n=1 Tax=Sporosarcina sp. 179-K 3D1 HS TaxID=3232169 RepID=UPI0039A0FC77